MLRCRNGLAALRHIVGGARGIEVLLLLIGRGNRPRRSREGLDSTGLPGFARVIIRLRRRGGRVRRNGCSVRLSQEARHEACDFLLVDRSKARHCAGRVEVSRILGQADEVADHGIA